MWRITPEWRGEVGVILAGGPSVLSQDLSLLRGRRVIAINSAWLTWPAADILFWADDKWFQRFGARGFAGRKVTCSQIVPNGVLGLSKVTRPNTLARDPGKVGMKHTSLAGAIGVGVHLGLRGIALLGADGRFAPDGRRHHHDTPYVWEPLKNWSQLHHAELLGLVEPLRERGVDIINASPGSAWEDIWPVMNLGEALASLDGERDAQPDRHIHAGR